MTTIAQQRFSPHNLSYRHIVIALGIVALAFALRSVVLVQRAQNGDDRFYPPIASDPEVHWRHATGFHDGVWPSQPYYNQPGLVYYYIALLTVLPRSIEVLYFAVALTDAIACGFMVAAGWLLTRRAWGGYLAGLGLALYPVAIFYGTTLLIAPFAMLLLTLWLGLMLWHRDCPALWRTALLGCIMGYVVVSRSNLAPIALIWVLWLWLIRPDSRAFVRHLVVGVVFAVLTVAPFTYWNWHSGGVLQLAAGSGWREIYAGNNRDTGGTGDGPIAYYQNDLPEREALVRDIAVAPARWLGLLARKAALHWHEAEIGNNITFAVTRDIAPALWWGLPLSFTGLALLGLAGLALLWYEDRALAIFFLLAFVWLTVALAISFGISRLRYPVVALLFPLAAYAVVQAPAWLKRPPRALVRQLGVPAIAIGLTLGLPVLVLEQDPAPLPPKRTYAQLPANAIELNAIYGDAIELVGWRPMSPWWPAGERGWAERGQAYAVELFWRVLHPTDQDYQFNLTYVVDGERYAGIDHPIGVISYPPTPTSIWTPDFIQGEIVSLRLIAGVPEAVSGALNVGVYLNTEAGIENVPVTQPATAPFLTLQRLAVYAGITDTLPDWPSVDYAFGASDERIRLMALVSPGPASPGTALTWQMAWRADSEIEGDYHLFVHITGADGTIVEQFDGPPSAGLRSPNWRPGHLITSTITLNAPAEPGNYTVFIGLYDVSNVQRLPTGTPDDRYELDDLIILAP